MLKKGQCIIWRDSIKKPLAMKIEYIKRKWLSNEEIIDKNKEILAKKEEPIKTRIEVILIIFLYRSIKKTIKILQFPCSEENCCKKNSIKYNNSFVHQIYQYYLLKLV
ncbi:hypothetical protein ES703_109424 [subsurface metagenome]